MTKQAFIFYIRPEYESANDGCTTKGGKGHPQSGFNLFSLLPRSELWEQHFAPKIEQHNELFSGGQTKLVHRTFLRQTDFFRLTSGASAFAWRLCFRSGFTISSNSLWNSTRPVAGMMIELCRPPQSSVMRSSRPRTFSFCPQKEPEGGQGQPACSFRFEREEKKSATLPVALEPDG